MLNIQLSMVVKLFRFITLLRVGQWCKNLFIFLPLFFGRKITNIHLLCSAIYAFFIFSFIASSIYCFNDIIDRKIDRLHPKKCKRPIADGSLSVFEGFLAFAFCLLISGLLFYNANLPIHSAFILIIYFILNLFYCFFIKQFAVIDVFVIAVGFVLRLVFGGEVTDIELSEWIIVMTFLLALFLAFAKRRDDVVLQEETGKTLRNNIYKYNLAFIDQIMSVLATIIVISYIIYCISPEVTNRFNSRYVYLTTFFVLGGIIRYFQLSIVEHRVGNPTKIFLTDNIIHYCIAGWLISFALIIYVF